MSRCAADLREAARALSSLTPVADAAMTTLAGARCLELTLPDRRHVPVAVMQVASAYGLRIDADHSGTRAADVLTVVVC